jgi:adenylate cyclase
MLRLTSSICARDNWRAGRRQEQLAAAERYRHALRLDPDFASAHAGLATVLAHLVFRAADLRASLAPEAQRAIDRALVLAPDSAATHVALGQVHSMFKRYTEAEHAFLRAIELDPRLFDAHYYYARFCASLGKHALAASHYEHASSLQPDEYLPIVLSIQEYHGADDYEGERRAIARSSVAIEQRLAIDPDDSAALGHGIGVMALLGRHQEWRQYAERAIGLNPHDGSAYYTAACGAALAQEFDLALDWLEKAVDLGFRDANWIAHDPDMDPLREDPRYQRLLERLA